jgi:Asp-tRNA(Asn)/Glu-tRNA(Gln) amidotransferase A subunit family amidase
MTQTVRDAAILLKSMASIDPKDSTSVDLPVPDYEKLLEGGIKGLKVGIPKEYRMDGAPPEIAALWDKGAEWLKAQGAEIIEISLPHTKYALPTYYIVAPGRPRPIWRAMTECASAIAPRARVTSPTFMRKAGPKVSGRKCSAAS